MKHYIHPIAPAHEGILLEGVALECGVEGVIAKPYPGDIYPDGGDITGDEFGIYPVPPFPKEGGTEEIIVRIEGVGGIKPVDPDWIPIIVKIEGARDIWREGWGGGNCLEGYRDIWVGEGHGGGINTGGGTGCKPVDPPWPREVYYGCEGYGG